MKKWKRLKKPILAAVFWLTVLTLLCGTTFTWYLETKSTEGTQAVVKSDSELAVLSEFTIYYSDGATVTGSNNDFVITLKSYDSVFGRNQNTPMYILLPISGKAVQNTGYTLNLTFDCNNDALVGGESGRILPYFSNVAQIRCVAVDTVPGSYQEAQNAFSGSEAACFASFTVDKSSHTVLSGSKNRTVSFTLDKHSANGEIYALFEVGYNFALIAGFVDNHANDFTGRLDTTQSLEFNGENYSETYLISVSAAKKAGA